MLNGYQFWKIVDEYNPYDTVLELSEKIGATYTKIRQQRANGTLPKASDLYKISQELHKPMEFLLTGKDSEPYPERVMRIIRFLTNFATEEDYILIERILRIPGKNHTISQKESS